VRPTAILSGAVVPLRQGGRLPDKRAVIRWAVALTGRFFEGAMTFGAPPDEVDDAMQAKMVAAAAMSDAATAGAVRCPPARENPHRTVPAGPIRAQHELP